MMPLWKGESAMEDIKTFDEAVKRLVEVDFVNSPDYWSKVNETTRNIDALFIKIANKI